VTSRHSGHPPLSNLQDGKHELVRAEVTVALYSTFFRESNNFDEDRALHDRYSIFPLAPVSIVDIRRILTA